MTQFEFISVAGPLPFHDGKKTDSDPLDQGIDLAPRSGQALRQGDGPVTRGVRPALRGRAGQPNRSDPQALSERMNAATTPAMGLAD